MRQKQTKAKPEERRVAGEPLIEGPIPRRENGQRDWAAISDGELVLLARNLISGYGTCTKSELHKTDSGLYCILSRRGLLEDVGLEKKHRWASMRDKELVDHARRFIEEEGICGRTDIARIEPGMYDALKKRGLLDGLGLERRYRVWNTLCDDGLMELTKKLLAEKGIGKKCQLARRYPGLHGILRRRDLLDRIDFADERRRWKWMSDGELVGFARGVLAENGITSRGMLSKFDPGLYKILWDRKLVEAAFSDIEGYKEEQGMREVMQALEEF